MKKLHRGSSKSPAKGSKTNPKTSNSSSGVPPSSTSPKAYRDKETSSYSETDSEDDCGKEIETVITKSKRKSSPGHIPSQHQQSHHSYTQGEAPTFLVENTDAEEIIKAFEYLVEAEAISEKPNRKRISMSSNNSTSPSSCEKEKEPKEGKKEKGKNRAKDSDYVVAETNATGSNGFPNLSSFSRPPIPNSRSNKNINYPKDKEKENTRGLGAPETDSDGKGTVSSMEDIEPGALNLRTQVRAIQELILI